ncbi:MAG: prephenate dehydratase [Actinomycetota bacterium]|nr:prephenate dehydratase [Actinomycetota bacterium]
MTVAYLGPSGTFAETAARLVAGTEPLVDLPDVAEVLRAVGENRADRGVVPIENTLEGPVSTTLDALAFDVDLLIQGELELPIHFVLATRPNVRLAEVRVVRSHQVALAACRRWLAGNLPDAERVAATSTAKAAELVAANEGPEAAISNQLAAERYSLAIVARSIADREGNVTRFVVVGHDLPPATGWDKTSLVVFIEENRPGALLKLLEIFAERDLNLTKIESRPTKAELGEYCFFMDVEGHLADERVGDALAAVKRTHREVKILGSYRRSGARQTEEAERIAADDADYRAAAQWLVDWRARVKRP